jgi:26S proteasome regulatory subunit N1
MSEQRERATQSIMVLSEDPAKKDDKQKGKEGDGDKAVNGSATQDEKNKSAKKKEDELNEEDLQLKNELEMLVERLKVGCEASSHLRT